MSRATLVCGSAFVVLGTVVLWGCASPGTAETQESESAHAPFNGAAFIGNGLPVFNTSALDRGAPILANPALGQEVAAALGKGRAVLLAGHGFVLTAPSIYNLVDQAYQLRQNAVIQRQAIGLRGKVSFLNEQPAQAVQPNEPQAPAPTGPPEGRSWIYWSQNVSLD